MRKFHPVLEDVVHWEIWGWRTRVKANVIRTLNWSGKKKPDPLRYALNHVLKIIPAKRLFEILLCLKCSKWFIIKLNNHSNKIYQIYSTIGSLNQCKSIDPNYEPVRVIVHYTKLEQKKIRTKVFVSFFIFPLNVFMFEIAM